jgi:transcriptional regulator with XRE-family HTH domain
MNAEVSHLAASEERDALREMQKTWLRQARDHAGITFTELARRIGMAPGSLSRFVNDDTRPSQMRLDTMRKVAAATGLPIPGDVVEVSQAREPEAEPWQPGGEGDALDVFVTTMVTTPNRFAWVMRGDALAHEGHRPGDVLIFDMAATPKEGDIVLAQFYARNDSERTETVCRLLTRRFLVAAGPWRADREPREAADPSVRIMGVMEAALRRRR